MKFNIVYELNEKIKKSNILQPYYVFENKTLEEAVKIIKKCEDNEYYKFIRMIESQEN